jgi:putative transcriptional regulator
MLHVVYTDRGDVRRIISSAQGKPTGAGSMAIVLRMALAEIKARGTKIDHAKVAATTEEDVAGVAMIEDGEDPDAPIPAGAVGALPGTIRRRLGVTQEQFASLLSVPIATLRNWEQARVEPSPTARALLRILDREPEAALRALAAPAGARP